MKTSCPHCTDGIIPGFAHKKGGKCYHCNGTGKAPVASAERYFSNGPVVVKLRYESKGGRHVVSVGVDGKAAQSERFARVEDARGYWASAQADLLAAGFGPYCAF